MKTIACKNPIISGRGICDPHIHIFRDTAYLYASHDASADNVDYTMHNWEVWSSNDLVAWQREAVVRPEDTYIGSSSSCWATDAAERNGHFYLYISNGSKDTGVLISDHPGGPFTTCRDGPLLPSGLTPTKSYDPAVFIDDDEEQTPYVIFGTPVWAGGDSYYIARLNEDMCSLSGSPQKLQVNDSADDKPFLHKRSGIYYLSWASYYAVSDTVTGPYRLAGNFGASADHGSIFEWNGQWFNAFTMFDPSVYHRATGICYIHFRRDGGMVADPMIIEHGVGQYQAGWNRIEAEWYMSASGVEKVENSRFGFELGEMVDGSNVLFPKVHGIPQNARMAFYAACNSAGCSIEVHEKEPDGPILGECRLDPTGTFEWMGYRTFLCTLENTGGTKDLCFVFRGDGKDFLRLDWFRFC